MSRQDFVKEEYRDSDGYWIYLKPGYQCGDDPGTHGIVEDTKRDARSRLSSVIPCDCDDCQKQPGYEKRTIAANKSTRVTREISGVPVTLNAGVRYRASRPFSERGRKVYPVTIERLDDPVQDVLVVGGLSYQDADRLVNEFNNGPTSFDGRIW